MTRRRCDIAIVGGGLSGGLIALALGRRRPELSVLLVEGGSALGGNHRWSWFESDLSEEGRKLIEPIAKAQWNDGYDVRFPGLSRRLSTAYGSIASTDFSAALVRLLPDRAILTDSCAVALDSAGVTLADGTRIDAGAVIDCGGHCPTTRLTGGWQLFYGRHLKLDRPHGLGRPTIMDATVEQHGAYRFVYVLPVAPDEIFVEDTYYADAPLLDRTTLSGRVDAYCDKAGWRGETMGEETGVLPVITGGDFADFQAENRISGVARAGMRAGLVHPLTSYSLPQAVETALAIAREPDLSGAALCTMLEDRALRHWRATRFYRLLGTMLFGAADPGQRYRVFERFYGLPESLIERFYAARSTHFDRARILCGRPPVPIGRALAALLRPGASMAREKAA